MKTEHSNPCDQSMQLPVQIVAELIAYAENELAALYSAVNRLFGLEQAQLTADDWLRELEVMEWPSELPIPNWRQLTAVAVSRLADRIGGRRYLCQSMDNCGGTSFQSVQ